MTSWMNWSSTTSSCLTMKTRNCCLKKRMTKSSTMTMTMTRMRSSMSRKTKSSTMKMKTNCVSCCC